MAKTKSTSAEFRCSECGWVTPKWVGRCGECQAWGTVDEVGGGPTGRTQAGTVTTAAAPMSQIRVEAAVAASSGIGELDRVLGGGVVKGAVMLLAGEPGVGKSTLLLEVASRWSRAGARTLYVTGEESTAQVRLRADRTDAVRDELYLAAETDLGALLAHVDAVSPSLLVVDSVQTIGSAAVDGVPGGVTQVREVTATLVQVAKQRGIATLLVGHVTKDGAVAGPRTLEHLVDVVLSFEGERHSRLRMIRAVKNRFGPVDEVGCFDLGADGITEVTDPTGLFVSRHDTPVTGTCLTLTMEGRRPLLAEVQALVTPSAIPTPRRSSSGLDSTRTAMLLAVLGQRAGVPLAGSDVYTATVGGARLSEPGADLAVALAVASAHGGDPIGSDVVVVGEVGLAGEVRRVDGVAQRVAEAARLGATTVLVPAGSDVTAPAGVTVVPVADVVAALRAVGVRPGSGSVRSVG